MDEAYRRPEDPEEEPGLVAPAGRQPFEKGGNIVNLANLFGKPNVPRLESKGDIAGLVRAVKYEKDVNVQETAAQALRRLEGVRAADVFVKILTTSRYASREFEIASRTLVEIGPTAVDPLLATLEEEQKNNLEPRAALVLGKMGDSRAVEPLIAAVFPEFWRSLHTTAAPVRSLKPWHLAEARKLLVKIGAAAVEPLVATLRGDPGERYESASMLEQIGAAAVEPLKAALKDTSDADQEVRTTILRSLEALGWRPEDNLERTLHALESLRNARSLYDKEASEAAIWALANIADKRAVKALLNEISPAAPPSAGLGPDFKPTEALAYEALLTIGDVAVSPLIAALEEEPATQWVAATALGRIGDARAVDPLVKVLGHESSATRRAAVVALGEIGGARAVGPLVTMLKDTNRWVRQTAGEALESLGWQAADGAELALHAVALSRWEDAARAGRPAVEPLTLALMEGIGGEELATALGEIGDARAVGALLARIGDKDVTTSVVAALQRIVVLDSRSVPMESLHAIVCLEDQLEQRQVVPGGWDGPRPGGIMHTSAYRYSSVDCTLLKELARAELERRSRS